MGEEKSITNPQTVPITVAHRLYDNGDDYQRDDTVPAGKAVRWDNYLQQFWGLSENAGLYLWPTPP
ncbi:MAG: hypothetical protein ACK42L_02225 [Thermoanaerobaculum sp.]